MGKIINEYVYIIGKPFYIIQETSILEYYDIIFISNSLDKCKDYFEHCPNFSLYFLYEIITNIFNKENFNKKNIKKYKFEPETNEFTEIMQFQ